jgi:hypothetical protein
MKARIPHRRSSLTEIASPSGSSSAAAYIGVSTIRSISTQPSPPRDWMKTVWIDGQSARLDDDRA